MQSKLESLIEALANIFSGVVLSTILGYYLYPAFGFPATVMQSAQITLIFTSVSLLRSYFWRRLFNRRQIRKWRAHSDATQP